MANYENKRAFCVAKAKEVFETVNKKVNQVDKDSCLRWLEIYISEAWHEGYAAGLDLALDMLHKEIQ